MTKNDSQSLDDTRSSHHISDFYESPEYEKMSEQPEEAPDIEPGRPHNFIWVSKECFRKPVMLGFILYDSKNLEKYTKTRSERNTPPIIDPETLTHLMKNIQMEKGKLIVPLSSLKQVHLEYMCQLIEFNSSR